MPSCHGQRDEFSPCFRNVWETPQAGFNLVCPDSLDNINANMLASLHDEGIGHKQQCWRYDSGDQLYYFSHCSMIDSINSMSGVDVRETQAGHS